MAKALLILVLFAAAIFAGMKWWPKEYIPVIAFPNVQKEPPKAELSVESLPETVEENAITADTSFTIATPPSDEVLQTQAREEVVARLLEKGAQVIDKSIFPTMQACESAVGVITAEYQRRGIQASNIEDASAMFDSQGAKVTAVNNMDGYFYLVCKPYPAKPWVVYVQFKLTDEQIRLLNQGASAN
jgi:hypothetical protein